MVCLKVRRRESKSLCIFTQYLFDKTGHAGSTNLVPSKWPVYIQYTDVLYSTVLVVQYPFTLHQAPKLDKLINNGLRVCFDIHTEPYSLMLIGKVITL